MKLTRICYQALSLKHRKIYDFQKVSGLLADYGYNCNIPLDIWKGDEFLAHHIDGHTLKVRLKGRMLIDKRYEGKDLYLCFPANCIWYLVPYDELLRIVEDVLPGTFKTLSWERGQYSWPNPPGLVIERLTEFRIGPVERNC